MTKAPRVQPIDGCSDLEDARPSTRAGTTNVVADVLGRALGARSPGPISSRRKSLDVARLGHVLHPLRHRPGVTSGADLGSTPHPDDTFMRRVARTLTMADQRTCQVLVCDRDRKWSRGARKLLAGAVIRVVRTHERAPNANAFAERFVRSITEECLGRLIPIGARHFQHAVREFVEHAHRERNHQGLNNALITGAPLGTGGRIRRHPRLGGLLNYYDRVSRSSPRPNNGILRGCRV